MSADRPVIGSLCSGYGGLDLGLALALGTSVRHAWQVEYDKHPSAILAHRFPGVPNHGDITSTDWTQVEPIDWLTAGYPCQPFSHVGNRKGTADARHIWPHVADAIRHLRPGHVLLENVAGHLSLGFGQVLGDLAALGYDTRWVCLRAADAGAPHGRARVFIVATDTTGDAGRLSDGDGLPVGVGRGFTRSVASDTSGQRHGRGVHPADVGRVDSPDAGQAPERQRARQEPGDRSAAPAADADRGRRGEPDAGLRGVSVLDAGCDGAASDAEGNEQREQAVSGSLRPQSWDGDNGAASDAAGNGGEGRTEPAGLVGRPDAAERGMPAAPDADDTNGRRSDAFRRQVGRDAAASRSEGSIEWGAYAPAIHRWEAILGRPAPRPTEPGRNGERLSPRFVEFLMGLPDGWVTDVPGLPRNAQLKALGNGVVPQQAALALSVLLPLTEAAAA